MKGKEARCHTGGAGQWTYNTGELCRQEMSHTPASSQRPPSQHSVDSDPPRWFRQRLGFTSSYPYGKMDADTLHLSFENSGCWGGRVWSEWPRWTRTQVTLWCQRLWDASPASPLCRPILGTLRGPPLPLKDCTYESTGDSHPDVHLSPVQGRIKTTSLGNSEDNCILTCLIGFWRGLYSNFCLPEWCRDLSNKPKLVVNGSERNPIKVQNLNLTRAWNWT